MKIYTTKWENDFLEFSFYLFFYSTQKRVEGKNDQKYGNQKFKLLKTKQIRISAFTFTFFKGIYVYMGKKDSKQSTSNSLRERSEKEANAYRYIGLNADESK